MPAVEKWLPVVATCLAGSLVAMQAPVNSMLGKSVGTLGAVTINFLVGTALLLFITFVLAGGLDTGSESVPWYAWVGGGLAGAAYVTTALLAVRSLGAGGVTAATITGQLAASLVLDRLGVLGLEERPLSVGRALGVVLLAVGTLLVVRGD
jgi:bacterial/archaeal transporter family-2 protein